MAKKKHKKKAQSKITNQLLTLEFLDQRERSFDKYERPKWMYFARHFLEKGWQVELYEARQTFSKYLTVIYNNRRYKVRFSNHKPILEREINGDCDYFVGRTNLRTTNTDSAIMATEIFLEMEEAHA